MKLDLSGPRARLDLNDPALGLTDAQRAAMAIDRELIVSAGAGAGKTRTLALRYVELLLALAEEAVEQRRSSPRPDIEAVLVLTFTDKAAQEMSARCYDRLLALAKAVRDEEAAIAARYGADRARSLAAAVDHLVETFALARISTFHGFCTRLLREYPAEAGVPPGFEVLDELRARRVMDEVAERAFTELATNDHDALTLLLDAFNTRTTLLEALHTAIEARGVLRPRLYAHARGEVEIGWLLDRASPRPAAVRGWLERQGRFVIERTVGILDPVIDRLAWAQSVGLTRILDELRRLPDDPLLVNELYVRALSSILGDKDQPRTVRTHTTVGKVADWPNKAHYQRALDELEALWSSTSDWPGLLREARHLPTRADATMLEVLRAFSRLALRAEDLLEAELTAREGIDFAGLQSRAARAIAARAALLQQLRARHRYLMVDEVQDTDQVQWEIVRAIGRPEGPEIPSDRIFLVGDIKQSIYAFRGGDVTVVRTATADMQVDPVVFPENFRSRPGIIGWFNELFPKVLGPYDPRRPAYEAHYEPLRVARASQGELSEGTVTLILHGEKRGGVAAEREADMAARFVGGKILAGREQFADLRALDRAVHPTPPVAVLLRARTHLHRFEAAFRQHGIPYVVAAGVGFWSRPEIVDLVNIFDALATGEKTSLVGALRSPLLGVEDQDVQRLHAEGLLDSFEYRPLPDGFGARAQSARALFQRLFRLKDRLSAAALFSEMIAEASAWHQFALTDSSGQAEANARRLMSLVADLQEQGLEGPEELARYLVAQVEDGTRQNEASITPSAARVVFMTVHASKGLEFPVVVVPGCGDVPIPRRESLAVRRDGGRWELACQVPDRFAEIQGRARPSLYEQLYSIQRAEESAESKRLFYVAVTRAKDHLVLLGGPRDGTGAGESWLKQVLHHHGQPPISRGAFYAVDGDDLSDLAVPPLRVSAELPPPGPDVAREVGPIAETWEVELSPSGLDLYTECPARWYRRHLLGVSEHVNRRMQREEALAAARGEVIHGLLEDDLAQDLAVARTRWEARANAEGCTPDEVERLFRVLCEHLEKTADDAWLRAVLDSEGWPEVPFRIAVGDLVVRGKIDRIWKDKDGSWSVLDYKSETLPATAIEAAARHERQLACYVWAAGRVMSARGLPPVGRAQIFFTERADVVELERFTPERLAEFEALLAEIGGLCRKGWSEVEDEVTRGPAPRACRDCGFYTRGCRGWSAGS